MPLCYKPIILDAGLLVAVEAHKRSQAKVGSHESMTLRVFREGEGFGGGAAWKMNATILPA